MALPEAEIKAEIEAHLKEAPYERGRTDDLYLIITLLQFPTHTLVENVTRKDKQEKPDLIVLTPTCASTCTLWGVSPFDHV
jgi:hypothetical protein